MITCKEDLINTYADNTQEIRKAYFNACETFGIKHEKNGDAHGELNEFNAEFMEVYNGNLIYTNMPERINKLTIDDLCVSPTKQSTAVEALERMGYEWNGGEWTKEKHVEYEYIKVTDSIFDLRHDFEAGDLYAKHKNKDKYYQVNTEMWVVSALNNNNLYRRTEKQVDWLSEVMDKFSIQRNDRGLISMTYNDVGFADPVFLEMCRTALRARGEL